MEDIRSPRSCEHGDMEVVYKRVVVDPMGSIWPDGSPAHNRQPVFLQQAWRHGTAANTSARHGDGTG